MGTSNSLFSISEVQEDSSFISYANELDSYQIPSEEYKEPNARNPSLNEIYQAIEEAAIEIKNERQDIDDSNEDKKIIVHIFDITDSEIDYEEDLTIRYLKGQSLDEPVLSISGIKTHYRILIKLATQLTKYCGSIYVHNPCEVLFIKKGMNYEQIWNEVKEKSS